jgi:ribonuclease BN (tRNA processing enzyme)
VLIADCSYTAAEYPAKKGWGHGSFESSMRLAQEVGAKMLYCTHHEPTRSDDALEAVFQQALSTGSVPLGGPEYRLAREGEAFEF